MTGTASSPGTQELVEPRVAKLCRLHTDEAVLRYALEVETICECCRPVSDEAHPETRNKPDVGREYEERLANASVLTGRDVNQLRRQSFHLIVLMPA